MINGAFSQLHFSKIPKYMFILVGVFTGIIVLSSNIENALANCNVRSLVKSYHLNFPFWSTPSTMWGIK